MAEIAERAGLTKSTFFRHFTDKREALFWGQDALSGELREHESLKRAILAAELGSLAFRNAHARWAAPANQRISPTSHIGNWTG